jgi:hypothetical protein
MRRLALRIVLCLVIYFNSVWIIQKTLNAAAYLTAKSGADGLWQAVHEYPFASSLAVGFIAGLIPLQFWVSVSGFFSSDLPEFLKKLELEKMKRWVVVLLSPVFLMAIGGWIIDWETMHSEKVSVLAGSLSAPISSIFEGFLSETCKNVSDVRLDIWPDNFWFRCMLHIQLVSVCLITAGYSLAPWFRQGISRDLATSADAEDPEFETASASRILESTDEK